MDNVSTTITNSEPAVVDTVVSIIDKLGYEVDTFHGNTIAEVNGFFSELMSGFGFTGAEITSMLVSLYSTLGYDLTGFTGTTVAELSAFVSGIIANSGEIESGVNQDADSVQENVTTAAEESESAVSDSTGEIQGHMDETSANATENSGVFVKGMEDMATGVADAASAIASTPIRPIVDTSSIDAGIAKLNSFLALVAQAGSASVSVSGSFSVPHMASGGVIPPNKPFLAMLGDQTRGTNVEAPLSTITEAMKQALTSFGYSNNNAPQEIVLNIDGTTLARVTVPYNLDELNRKGYNVKVLEGK